MQHGDHCNLRGKLDEVTAEQQAAEVRQHAAVASQAEGFRVVQCQQAAEQQQLNMLTTASGDLATTFLPGNTAPQQQAARNFLNQKADGNLFVVRPPPPPPPSLPPLPP